MAERTRWAGSGASEKATRRPNDPPPARELASAMTIPNPQPSVEVSLIVPPSMRSWRRSVTGEPVALIARPLPQALQEVPEPAAGQDAAHLTREHQAEAASLVERWHTAMKVSFGKARCLPYSQRKRRGRCWTKARAAVGARRREHAGPRTRSVAALVSQHTRSFLWPLCVS